MTAEEGEGGDMKGERLGEGRWKGRKESPGEGKGRKGRKCGGLFVDFKRGEWKAWDIAWKHRHAL